MRTMESALLRSGLGPVAGVDEAGRGACAGPLVVAACILGDRARTALDLLDDSKKLSEKTRESLFPRVIRWATAYSIVTVPAEEVDRIGIHVANIEGMRRAVMGLDPTPGYVLTDGFRVPGLAVPSLPVIGGDATAACIAAASVLAKVHRDRIMRALDTELPGYSFSVHKGYNTALHTEALAALGPTAEHRRSWSNVAALSGPEVHPRRVGWNPSVVVREDELSTATTTSGTAASVDRRTVSRGGCPLR